MTCFTEVVWKRTCEPAVSPRCAYAAVSVKKKHKSVEKVLDKI